MTMRVGKRGSTGACWRRGLGCIVAAIVLCVPPNGSSSTAAEPDQGVDKKAGPTGRVFFFASKAPKQDPFVGVYAIDVADGTWREVVRDASVMGRISPDGHTLACKCLTRDRSLLTGNKAWAQPTFNANRGQGMLNSQ